MGSGDCIMLGRVLSVAVLTLRVEIRCKLRQPFTSSMILAGKRPMLCCEFICIRFL